MEEKKKSTKKKVTTKSKDQYKKGKAGVAARKEAEKKATAKKATTKKTAEKEVEKKTTKKAEEKVEKKVTKKVVAPKEVKEEKKVEKKVSRKKVEKEVETDLSEETEDIDFLERTLIFDGKEKDNLRNVVEKLENDTVFTKDKVVKRKKSHKIAIIILTALIFVTLIISSVYVITKVLEDKRNSETINSNIYQKVLDNYENGVVEVPNEETTDTYEHIHTISLKEFESNILKKTNMTILIASDTCLGCIVLESDLEPKLEEADTTILRISISNMEESEVTRLRTYYHFTSTPAVFNVENGVVTKDSSEVASDDEEAMINWILTNSIK